MWRPEFVPVAKGVCAATSVVTNLFVVMILIGVTSGRGMSPEFKPLFGCFVVL